MSAAAAAHGWTGPGQPGASPLVFDSPHSSRLWPAWATRPQVSTAALDSGWDAWVDEMWALACGGRSPVLAAHFHRACLDANRPRDDIDQDLLDAPWPGPIQSSSACRRGMGLIRRLALPGQPLYAQPLPVSEVQQRIQALYDPYHQALQDMIQAAQARWGQVLHLNVHSVKSVGNDMNVDSGQAPPDMVLSNLNGQTCAPALLAQLGERLQALGFRVQLNDPYQGNECIRRHAHPAQGRHSVQIELNRALYMDERAMTRHAGFDRLVTQLQAFVLGLERETPWR